MNKKAMADIPSSFLYQWPEMIAGVLLIVGLVVSISLQNEYLSYGVIFCAGLMVGRLIYFTKGRQPIFPFLLISFVFLVGYVIGSFRFNRFIIILLFLAGALMGYEIYKKGYLK